MRINLNGKTQKGVTAKDLILGLIGKIGTAGGTGHVIEYAGSAIKNLSMEGRMTICNMSIEAGARAGLIAPDEITFNYIKGRNFEINNFYEGISRFNFNELCDQNLGAEDYLKISENSNFIIIENIPKFNDINSNQQHRFITLIDVIYDKEIAIAVTAKQSLEKLSSSKSLEKPFKRTISRLFELTSKNY